MNKILENLGINEISMGSCFGGEDWVDMVQTII